MVDILFLVWLVALMVFLLAGGTAWMYLLFDVLDNWRKG